jgi:glycerol transport system ATP-binding protein
MAQIEFKELAHSYLRSPKSAADYALQPMDMTWDDGGAYALLGPSGSGKTTLLNIVSGLLFPSEGQVLLDGRDVTRLPTAQRNIAQVFQFPVIYDTMTVFDNFAFPLRNRKVPEQEVRRRVLQVAEMLGLENDLKKRASGLAADAKQKISLGRGLVRSDVAAILFDEPLTVIDPQLKWTLRRKLKEIHQELKLTFIYVTHDQSEALTFADKVVALHEGRAVQIGSPTDLFEHPAHTFVGHFIGSPGMNIMPCQIEGSNARLNGSAVALDPAYAERARRATGRLELGIRPEFVRYRASATEGFLLAEVTSVEDLGDYKIVSARLAGHLVKAKVSDDVAVSGGAGWFAFPPEWTRLYVDGAVLK